MKRETIVVHQRFRGPEGMGNGGYVSGLVAEALGRRAKVRLYAPTPLDRPLTLVADDERAALMDGDQLLVEALARGQRLDLDVPPAPGAAIIARGSSHFPDRAAHMAPGCFVCGIDRTPGDALCLHGGKDPETGLASCQWTPAQDLSGRDGKVALRYLWSALDCPSYFALGLGSETALLAGFSADIIRHPAPGEALVVSGWSRGSDGRKHRSASVIHDEGGAVLALADALWVALPQ